MEQGLLERSMAACAHLLALLPASLGLIVVGLMMIVLLPGHASAFLRNQLAQAFAYQALVAALSVLLFGLFFMIPGTPMGLEESSRIYIVLAIYVLTAAYALYAAHQSFHSQPFRYLLVGGMAVRLVQSAAVAGDDGGDGDDGPAAESQGERHEATKKQANGKREKNRR